MKLLVITKSSLLAQLHWFFCSYCACASATMLSFWWIESSFWSCCCKVESSRITRNFRASRNNFFNKITDQLALQVNTFEWYQSFNPHYTRKFQTNSCPLRQSLRNPACVLRKQTHWFSLGFHMRKAWDSRTSSPLDFYIFHYKEIMELLIIKINGDALFV